MFRRKRSSSTPPRPNPEGTTPAAQLAASQAFLAQKASDVNLSASAAAAALRSQATTPVPVGQIQTKRMQRRESVSSNASAAVRPGGLQRRDSNGSMSERTFRSPSPGPMERPSSSHGPYPAHDSRNAPPVPSVPDRYSAPVRHLQRPASALAHTSAGRAVQRSSSLTSRAPASGARLSKLDPIGEAANQAANRASVNFSRPMSPQNVPGAHNRPTSPVVRPSSVLEKPRKKKEDRPSSVIGDFAGENQTTKSDKVHERRVVDSTKKKNLKPKKVDAELAVSEEPQSPHEEALEALEGRMKTAPTLEPVKPKKKKKTEQDVVPARPTGMLVKQPSVVREDPEGEAIAEGRPVKAKKKRTSQLAINEIATVTPAKSKKSPARRLATPTEGRPASVSPARAARFSAQLSLDTPDAIRHQPPARSVSPAKSALKHSPSQRSSMTNSESGKKPKVKLTSTQDLPKETEDQRSADTAAEASAPPMPETLELPNIALMPATPELEKSGTNLMDEAAVTSPASAGIAEPEPAEVAGHHVGQVIRDPNSENDSEAEQGDVFTDAAEEHPDMEGDGFGSINAIIETPSLSKESPATAEGPAQWTDAQTYWSGLTTSQRKQLEDDATTRAVEEKIVAEPQGKPKRPVARAEGRRLSYQAITPQPRENPSTNARPASAAVSVAKPKTSHTMSNDSDSDSSFRKARKTKQVNDKYTMKRSMRTQPEAPERTRGLSPRGESASRVMMRTSMREHHASERPTSPSRFGFRLGSRSRSIEPMAAPSRSPRHASRFDDSSDDEPMQPVMRMSRFGDSSDEDAELPSSKVQTSQARKNNPMSSPKLTASLRSEKPEGTKIQTEEPDSPRRPQSLFGGFRRRTERSRVRTPTGEAPNRSPPPEMPGQVPTTPRSVDKGHEGASAHMIKDAAGMMLPKRAKLQRRTTPRGHAPTLDTSWPLPRKADANGAASAPTSAKPHSDDKARRTVSASHTPILRPTVRSTSATAASNVSTEGKKKKFPMLRKALGLHT